VAAAARAALDACELQDDRGSKRDALARTPPQPHRRPHASPTRRATEEDTRVAGAMQAALPLFVSCGDSIFNMFSGVGGGTAPTQSSTQKVASNGKEEGAVDISWRTWPLPFAR
jgi:hypothetical protein